MSLKLGTTNIAGLQTSTTVTGFDLFDCKFSDHLLNNIQWLRADTFSAHSAALYPSAYNKLVNEYNNATDIEINATKVGSPKVLDSGVVSGFGVSDYLTVDNPSSSLSSMEIVFKFTTSSDVTTRQTICGQVVTNKTSPQIDILATSGKFEFLLPSDTSTWVTISSDSVTATANTTYWGKMIWDGATLTAYLSTDNSTWTTVGSASMTTCVWTLPLCIGNDQPSSSNNFPWLGTIDLKESYIKVNGETFWTGEFCRKSPNGFKIATIDKEEAVIEKYENTGIAWYYLIDTTNAQFKLPRTKWGFNGLRSGVGNMVEQEVLLPDITGTFGKTQTISNDSYGNGAFTCVYEGQTGDANNGATNLYHWTFDASRSSSVYSGDGTNTKIQPPATEMYLYFYVGEYSRSAIEQTAGLNTELLNEKVDISSLTECHVVISTYVNGTSGYRVWSDGYCEQWGTTSCGEVTTATVTFLKTYLNTNYNLLAVQTNQSTASDTEVGIQFTPTSVSTATISTHYINPNTTTVAWRTFGYLAEGQY